MSIVDRRQGLITSVAIKAPCRVATTAAITLNGLQTVDGVTVVSGDRVLVHNQTDATENGIYVANTGDWTRDIDFNGTRDFVEGTIVAVISGTLYNETVWQLMTASPAIGSALVFSAMGLGALSGVSPYIQTLLPAPDAAAARTILGAVGLTGNETIAGNKTFTGASDFTGGSIAVPTASPGDNDTSAASTAFVTAAVAAVPAGFTTGDAIMTWKTTATSGWIIHNDGSIGNAASAATCRANADTSALFVLLYDQFNDTLAPVSGGRGANAAADFAANKNLTLPPALGRAIVVAGAGAGLTNRPLGDVAGAETVPVTAADLGIAMTNLGGAGSGTLASIPAEPTKDLSTIQPSAFWNIMIKL